MKICSAVIAAVLCMSAWERVIAASPSNTNKREQCPEYRVLDYMVIKGYKPVYKAGKTCATHFERPEDFDDQSSKGKCYYKGLFYNSTDSIPSNDECLLLYCSGPDVFRATPLCAYLPPPEGEDPNDCWLAYSLNGCCSSGYMCGKMDAHTCIWDGNSKYEGQRMNFEGDSRYACQTCVCSKEFSGPFGPLCKKRECSYEFDYKEKIKRGCVPLYKSGNCCPSGIICPGDKEIATEQSDAKLNGKDSTTDICRFGNFTVAINKELATTDPNITCKCDTPPDVTCETRS